MNIAGIPMTEGHSQRTSIGRNRKLFTENADTAAIYDAIIPIIWAYHQWSRSLGGNIISKRSTVDRMIPMIPKVIATGPSTSQTREGLMILNAIRAALPPKANTIAA